MGEVLRVAHVMHGLMMGGLEQVVVRLCEAGREQGIEPHVISFGADGSMRELLNQKKIPLTWFGDIKGMTPGTLSSIASELRKKKIDVAHAHDIGPWLNVVTARALAPRIRTAVTFHQIRNPAGMERPAAMAAALLSDAMIACGDEVKTSVAKWAPPGSRLETIGNGVPIGPMPTVAERAAARARMNLPEGAIALGYLGRMHEEKGVDLLVEAFLQTLAQRENVHLVLIGKGGLDQELKRRVAQSGCPRVHFMGEIMNATSLLAGLDIYVQPSRREGRSLSMLEAMAASLPTVAQGLPAMHEIHVDGGTALLVPPAERPAFGPAMVKLIDDPVFRRTMGDAARHHVRIFSIEEMAKQYRDVYQDLVERPRFGSPMGFFRRARAA